MANRHLKRGGDDIDAPVEAARSPESGRIDGRRAIGTAALILMAGNLMSSVLGFVRQAVIAKVFGATLGTDAFFAASIVPQMFYDLTIGAAVSAALIPTFTEILERRGRQELRELVGGVLAAVWLVLCVVVIALVVGARPLMTLILWGYHTHLRTGALDLAIKIARVLVPTLFFLGTSAVLLSALYSLRRFTASAFAGALYHVGVILGAIVLSLRIGILALPVGALAGAAGQAAVQVPPLLRAGMVPRPRLALTPDLRRIIRLYAPVAAGLIISVAGQIIDLGFKSELSGGAITAMQFATTLTQFPIGIAVAALSFAVLPSISSDAAFNRMNEFKDTLAGGMRFVLFLTIPAAIGYLALATPIISLLFQRGHFHPVATAHTASALTGYAVQIPFVGLDQLLIFSFYARKDTMTPMLVGVAGVGIYVVSALLLLSRYHILGLALANTIQNSSHAVILLALTVPAIGGLPARGIITSALRSLLAAGAMGVAAAWSAAALMPHIDIHRLSGQALDALVPILLGGAVYLLISAVLRSPELQVLTRVVRRVVP